MNSSLLNYDCYIFDLDNTLYDENVYLFSVYREISEFISSRYEFESEVVENYLINEFNERGRHKLLSKMITHFEINDALLSNLLLIMRTHVMSAPMLLFPKMRSFLLQLITCKKKTFVLTNGNVQQQKNKIKQIDWTGLNNIHFVFANEIEPKPSPKAIATIFSNHQLHGSNAILIGDSESDKCCAINANIDFIYVDELFEGE
ncbi:HAD family hydrolase [Lutimonas saemankumensis]|uniref:HAD family hydrolase n=1 Tax=Lutimonas saemankumensis TaxID=483016 RepID=UPI001CD2A5EA|nr:HAD family hydrolase [Lutimonas saemankumensis]MCA0931069.1 HAD family hydrolase [Lutimonas saemankumensis]